jgi:hypothetical protein
MFCGTAIPQSERHRENKRGLDMGDDWVRGWSRSTDFVIVVPGPFWRKVFLQKWASGKKWRTTEGDTLEEKDQTQTPSTKDEAQLNCVALRPPLHYEVAWTAVKGRDERQQTAPLTALHATGRSINDVGEKKYGGPPRRP